MGEPAAIAAEFNDRFAAAWNDGSAEALAALYAPDALLVGRAVVSGRAAVAQALVALRAQGWDSVSLNPVAARRSGDAILVVNDFCAIGGAGKLEARSSQVLVEVDGSWRSAMHTAA